MLIPQVQVRESTIAGHGLYVVEPIRAGTVVWKAEPDEDKYVVHRSVVESWPEDKKKEFLCVAYQVDEEHWSGVPEGVESDGSEYMNHSCDPNVVFRDENGTEMIATRDLEVGEEVTYDYATSEVESSSHLPMKCLCGSSHCRGEVTGSDYLLPSLRERYDGHFLAFLVRRQKAADAANAGDAAAGAEAEAAEEGTL